MNATNALPGTGFGSEPSALVISDAMRGGRSVICVGTRQTHASGLRHTLSS